MADRVEPEIPQEHADELKVAVPPNAETPSIPEISVPMLEVHAPHEALHTWKGFFIHIATIVVGLFIAVGLEQAVELVHHRYQVAETREVLRLERDSNRENLVEDSRFWRWGTAELKNNLLVLQYIQQHPGTPQEGLPGILVWRYRAATYNRASWNSGNQTGITMLMPRQEVQEAASLYSVIELVEGLSINAWLAISDADRYTLLDPDPSHLSTAAIADEITLTENALTKLYQKGVVLKTLHQNYPDFPETVTKEDLDRLRYPPEQSKAELLAPARALTEARLKAAGWRLSIPVGQPDASK